jgi:ketosteroid isomerase-like protein
LLDASASQRDVEFTVERHWVSGDTVLAAWHVAFTRRASGRLVRMAGFMTAEIVPDGRVARFREWTRYGPEGRG